jgi:hypothetical protein
MRVLVTSARMPFALALIRKLAEEGHEVYASDAYAFAPGSHSRFVTEHFVTAAPRDATEAFIADVARIANEHEIELIVPSFEEAFYLSTRHNLLAEDARLFFAPFATLAPLHDKASFERLAVHMGLPMAATVLATSDAELREGLERFPRYFARAAFSRGGVTLLTNAGPLAGKVAGRGLSPDPGQPLAGPGIRRRGDLLHLQHGPRWPGHGPLRLRDPAPVEALHRHPVHVPRRRRDARARPEDRGGDRVHRADLLRLHRVTGRGGACRVQPARHRRRAADGL